MMATAAPLVSGPGVRRGVNSGRSLRRRVSTPSPSPLGLHRVIGQPRMLPQPAEQLDASMPCQSTELEIAVECVHVDASSLRQLRAAHAGDLAAVRAAILELVRRRGKLHNPVTNSGGMLVGVVRAVGRPIRTRRRSGHGWPRSPASR